MPVEIERRFLVCGEQWRAGAVGARVYRQSYLSKTSDNSVRVRRSEDQATITVKGPRVGLARDEFEYLIPVSEADHMLGVLCVTPVIEKTRHWVDHAGMTWEVDVYLGEASGLVLAEVELERVDQTFAFPSWVGVEVTHDPRYRSSGIAQGLWRAANARPAKRATPPRSQARLALKLLASPPIRPG